MGKLKVLLYSCIKQNELFFRLINEFAKGGYLFWKKGDAQKNGILVNSSLADLLGASPTTQVQINNLEYDYKKIILSTIQSVENEVDKNLLKNNIYSVEHLLANVTSKLHFTVHYTTNSSEAYILTAFDKPTFFETFNAIEQISEILDVAVWQWNIITNKLIINEKWANILGFSIEELSPLSIHTYESLTHPDDLAISLSLIQDYIDGIIDHYSCEVRMRHKDGHWIWVLGKGKIASRTKAGDVEWIMGSHLDITERKIQEQEADILALVPKNTVSAVLITDQEGKILYSNQSFERITGYSSVTIIGKKPGQFLQGRETSKDDILSFRNKLASGKSFTQEILNYKKSGEVYQVSCYVDPIYNNKGEIIKYISIQTDITEKKRNEEYLATFKNTLDQTEDCVFIFDQDTLQFTYVNQGAINMMGYSNQELLQLHPYDIKPEYPENKFRKMVAPLLTGLQSSKRFKTLHRTKSGLDIEVEVFLQFIHNENVKPHFVAIVKDITKQIQIEQQLERLSLVAEKTNNLVVITDPKGRIEYVNPAFEFRSGYSMKEVLGHKPGKFLHGKETNPDHINANREGLKKLKPFTQEILNYTKSKEKYWVSITFDPVFNEANELRNFIAIEKEITENKIKEDLLKESEERLQFVLKGSELGYWDWAADTGKMTVNDRWYEMLGYNRNDFDATIDNWHALVHPVDMDKLNNIMQTVFLDPYKSEFYVELRAKHKNGHYIWILDRGAVVKRNKSGKVSRISGMHMEITEQKNLEKALETERNFLSKVISAEALSLIIINKSGEITFANSGAESILGLSKSKIESKNYNDPDWKHISIDEKPFPEEELPFVKVIESKETVKDIQHGIIWKDGTRKYISVTGGPFTFKDNEIEEVIFLVTDITKRIEAQKQLNKTKTQMQTILKDMADVVWSVSLPDYKMIYITPSIEKITGFSQSYYLENYVGEKWEERVFPQDRYMVEKAYADLDKKGSFEVEYRIHTQDNKLKWVLNKGSIIYLDGKAERLDGYISDISERKEQENELKKYLKIVEDQNERLKNFTYIVSHNLRSHSANIQGLMYLINKKHPEIGEVEYVKLLSKASNKLDDTLHHLNDIVSVVSSAEEMKQINLYDAINSFSESFQNIIEKSNINFEVNISKNIYVEAVPAFLDSIITNLITNAIKYRDEQKPDSFVKVSCRKFNGIVIISIMDNGLGIDLKKYGEKLYGMYKTFHTHKDSRGLGLFLTKNQIESIGGKIEVESKPGIGTTFKVFLKDGNI